MIKQTIRQNKHIEFICFTIIYMNKIKLYSKIQLQNIIQYNKINNFSVKTLIKYKKTNYKRLLQIII